MVKSYQRFEQNSVFGVVAGNTNSVWLAGENKNSAGEIIIGALERVNIWNIKTGELVDTLVDGLPPGSVDAKVSKPAAASCLEYFAETNLLAVGCSDGSIKVWDLLSRSVIINFNGHKSAISVLQFDATGTRLISGSRDSDIIVWDLVGEVGLYKLRAHKDSITGIWCESEDWLVSTSKDGLIKIWDLKTQQCIETHMAHVGECWSLGIYEDLAITTGHDAQIKAWKLDFDQPSGSKLIEKGAYLKQSKQRGLSIEFTVSPEGVCFFCIQNADRTVEIFRLRTQEEKQKAVKKREKRLKDKGMSDDGIQQNIQDSYMSFVMHPFDLIRSAFKVKSVSWASVTNSKLELVITTAGNSIEYYSIPYSRRDPTLPAPKKLYTLEREGHHQDIRAIDVSDDNKLLSSVSNGTLKIWNIKNKVCIRTFDCGYGLTCKFLPGGSLVIVGTKSGELQLYDLASSTLVESKEAAHDGAIWSLDLTGDGRRLVTASADKTVKFWTFEVRNIPNHGSTEKSLPRLQVIHDTTLEMNDDVLAVKISPDDKLLAISLLDNTVKVFFLDTMKFFLSMYGHKLPVLSIDISYDSKILITSSADKNIKIWGLDFGDCHKSLFAHNDSIMNVKFLPETHHFVSCSKDGLLKYWDGDKFECIQKLAGHQSEVWSLAVSNDASFFVSTSHDHSIRVWEETEDQVFLEEERERDLEEQYESTLLNSMQSGNGDDMFSKDSVEDQDEATDVHKQTTESLKASEKLIDALDLGMTEIKIFEQYEKDLKQWQKRKSGEAPTKPHPNGILVAIGKTPTEYIMDTLVQIKPAQLEDALLVLPFSYVLKLLDFIKLVTQDIQLLETRLPLICRYLLFVVKSNHRELVAQKNPQLKQQINEVKDGLRNALETKSNDLGFNIQGLKFVQQQWALKHDVEYVDSYQQKEHEQSKTKKRVFGNIA